MNEKEFKELIGSLKKMVPTLLVVGKTADGDGIVLMGSPEETEREKALALCSVIAEAIGMNKKLQEVLYTCVLHHMYKNPKYSEAARLTLKQANKFFEQLQRNAAASKMMDKTKN